MGNKQGNSAPDSGMHRWFAVTANNRGWELWERAEWTSAEAEEMIHAAHVAWYHWDVCGTDIHRARAYVLLAYTHAKSGSLSLANTYAEHASFLFDKKPDGIADWDHVFLLDAQRRILYLQGKRDESAKKNREARQALANVASDEDREYAEKTLDREFSAERMESGGA